MLSLWSNKEDLFKLFQHPTVSGLHARREPEGREWGQRGGGWGGNCEFLTVSQRKYLLHWVRAQTWQEPLSKPGRSPLWAWWLSRADSCEKAIFILPEKIWCLTTEEAFGSKRAACKALLFACLRWRTLANTKGIFPSALERPSVILPQCSTGETLHKQEPFCQSSLETLPRRSRPRMSYILHPSLPFCILPFYCSIERGREHCL